MTARQHRQSRRRALQSANEVVRPSWLLWLPGLRGPRPQRLENRGDGSEPVLDHGERKYQLASPVRIADEHLGLGLDELARVYPAPQRGEGTEQ